MRAFKKVLKKSIQQLGYEITKISKNPSHCFKSNSITGSNIRVPNCNIYPDKTFFLVTSYGLSASNWFAYALNIHPDITCLHSEENRLATKDMHTPQQKAETVYESYKLRINKTNQTLDNFFAQIVDKGDTSVCGGVHTHRLSDLQLIENKHRGSIYFKLMNLIRHPISMTNSGEGLVAEFIEYDIYFLNGIIGSILNESEFFFKLARDFKLNLLDKSVLAFIGGCVIFFDLGNDLKTLYKPLNIKMELLTSDRDYFKAIVQDLSQNKIAITSEYLDQVFNAGVVNQHSQRPKRQPAQIYMEWQQWQKECFNFCANKMGIINHYANLQYDFSFLN